MPLDRVIQGSTWNFGTHHTEVSQRVVSPGSESQPISMGIAADVEFVSGTAVRLKPGFHAGSFYGAGHFRAYIDPALGPPADIVLIDPDPVTHFQEGTLHVEKWEKLEVGLRLPQDYQDAIDRFFGHYYPSASGPSTPGNVDVTHDLNPYADDSLQLVMTLLGPDGHYRMKWGFFMREAKWAVDTDPMASLVAAPDGPLDPYNIRFRFAPDEVGPWQFDLTLRAPHTRTLLGQPLPDLQYAGFTFMCTLPLEDNHGRLQVDRANGRLLQFRGDEAEGDELPFFALGTNMADVRHSSGDFAGAWDRFYLRDMEEMKLSMERLHEVGGNFMRMYLMRNLFAPEWVNLGVYDKYCVAGTCADSPPWCSQGNCQYQCWAFDKILDHARDQGIYLQLCVDPYPPIGAYEDIQWGAHAYVMNFLEHNRNDEGRYDLKHFFYDDGNMQNIGSGIFYYWKRKYKYIMSRWGYSVNMAIIEPFNEIDQMLTYRHTDLTNGSGICPENQIEWPEDHDLPETLDSWLTDLITYVRGNQDIVHPETSPLGESKLFLMSYTQAQEANTMDEDHYLPFRNELVDLIDIHKGFYPNMQGPDNEAVSSVVDWRMHEGFEHANAFWHQFPSAVALPSERKPFNHGEFTHYTNFTVPDPLGGSPLWKHDVETIFHNYDISFHNELWSSIFSGKFAAGTTWSWERVFWWEDALVEPPEDGSNDFYWSPTQQFSNVAGDVNNLLVVGSPKPVRNNRLHHHFRPLADLLNRPSVAGLGIFNDHFTAEKFFDDDDSDGINSLEAYYLKNDWSTAIGWVHNRNASVAKSYYVKSGIGNENFLGCTAPASASITLSGFFPSHAHYITWFPTRVGATDLPPDTGELPLMSTSTGDLVIDLTGQFNAIADNYLDTLHADYAFVITPQLFHKSLHQADVTAEPATVWDFTLFPNPANDMLTLLFPDDAGKEVVILDVSGRRVARYAEVATSSFQLSANQFAKGAYWVVVTRGMDRKTKKLIIH